MVSDTDSSVRVNAVFSSFASRRVADKYVAEGRVTLNGKIAQHGARVRPGDLVELDDELVEWEKNEQQKHYYIKVWKARGVITTCDDRIENSIFDTLRLPFKRRVFPVGRLDEDTEGLLILTSDGQIPQIALGAGRGSKVYMVEPDRRVSERDLEQLRSGVVIKTVAQRDRNVRKPLVAKTLPCQVERTHNHWLKFTLSEGRNRQLRKMLPAVGYTVRSIHRTGFLGITLEGLARPGDWAHLNESELKRLRSSDKDPVVSHSGR